MSKSQQNISKPLETPVEKQETQKERQAETVIGPSFESLIKLMETPPYIQKILSQYSKSALEQIDIAIMNELKKNSKGETAENLKKYQAQIDKLLNEIEKNEFTYSEARHIFEKAVIEAVSSYLTEDQKITLPSDARLEWFVNEDRPEGSFGFVQVQKKQENPVTYVTESGVTKEGEIETINVRVMPEEEKSGSLKKNLDFYYIEPELIKEIFNKLEPQVRESIISGLKDQIRENIKYEFAQEKINKEIKALI
jgi:hypothetical protein